MGANSSTPQRKAHSKYMSKSSTTDSNLSKHLPQNSRTRRQQNPQAVIDAAAGFFNGFRKSIIQQINSRKAPSTRIVDNSIPTGETRQVPVSRVTSKELAPVVRMDDITGEGLPRSLQASNKRQPEKTYKRSSTFQSQPTMHVRIRISCSDNISNALRRNHASTQTEVNLATETSEKSTKKFNARHSTGSYQQRRVDKENRLLVDSGKSISKSLSSTNTDGGMSSSSSSGVGTSTGDDARSFSDLSGATSANSMSPQDVDVKPVDHRAVVTKRTTIQASTGELLECLGQFVKGKFNHIGGVSSSTVVNWMRIIDRALISQGWQDAPFISPGTIVFVYLLLRDATMPLPTARITTLSPSATQRQIDYQQRAKNATLFDSSLKQTLYDLRCHIHACLYMAFSYAGIEISYPQRPFNIAEVPVPPTPPTSTVDFWQRVLDITVELSEKMLQLNSDPLFFARTFAELKSHGVASVATNTTAANCLEHHKSTYGNVEPHHGTLINYDSDRIVKQHTQVRLVNSNEFYSKYPSRHLHHHYHHLNNYCRDSTVRDRAGEHYAPLII